MDNFINGVRISDPIVNISHNINTDVAEDILGLDILGEGGLAEASNSEESEELVHVVLDEVLDIDLSFSGPQAAFIHDLIFPFVIDLNESTAFILVVLVNCRKQGLIKESIP